MLQLAGVSKAYGGQVVLADVTWTVAPGTRVGLAGPNGAGKSTLLRLIAGEIEPDRGVVTMPRGTRVGYLPQHILGGAGTTVLAHALSAFAELHALEARRTDLEHQLATVDPASAAYAALMERYVAVCEEWDHRGRYDTEAEARAVLRGLGFGEADLGRDLGALSGGWQMRAHLARLLLERPDVLLLDEPTNYLDLEARNWLEEFLASYPGTVILVAHDRYFLDVAVERTAEVLNGRVTDYPMPYSRYLEEREKRLELARAAYAQQQEEIARIEAFISRFRYQASKVGQNVQLAYFAQDHGEMLDAERTVLEEVLRVATVETAPHVRALLGAFLFSGDAVDKRVGVLSGGERSRLALAKLLLQPANCLLLDEPTNHLDLTAKEVLL